MADRGWNYYTLQCGAIMTLILPSDCTLQQGFFKDQFRTAQSSNSMASAEREPIMGVWGRSP